MSSWFSVGHVVVERGESEVGSAHLPAGQSQTVERLRAGHLVNEMAIDIKQCGLGGRGHDVAIPHLLEQRLWHARSTFASSA